MAGQYISVTSSQSTNEAGNQSTVSVNMTLYSNGWSFDGWTTGYGLRIGDQWWTGTWIRTLYNPNSASIGVSRTYTHDANGYRGDVSTEAYFDGTGPYMPDYLSAGGGSYGAIDYVRLPGAPSSVTAVAVGSVITVTSGEASTPGPTITAYKVSYASSTNGGSTWSSWSSESNMTSRVYTYSSLTPGLTYKFRVRATNGDGDGPFTESNTLFLTAGGKRYTGTNWALTVAAAKRFNGSAWVSLATAKRYDDVTKTWVTLS